MVDSKINFLCMLLRVTDQVYWVEIGKLASENYIELEKYQFGFCIRQSDYEVT